MDEREEKVAVEGVGQKMWLQKQKWGAGKVAALEIVGKENPRKRKNEGFWLESIGEKKKEIFGWREGTTAVEVPKGSKLRGEGSFFLGVGREIFWGREEILEKL